MEGFVVTRELVLMLMPLIILQVGMFVYCASKIYWEGVENLNGWIWILICLFVNLVGPIAFLIAGRKREYR
ncbi:MAG: PLDc N-terminal domain-containing protein [Gudongella sp.]|nr:PLDc N-terminal domain-containing protein [Gudongella sp.]